MRKILLLLATSLSFFNIQAQIIVTAAGNGINGFSGDGGQATAAELNNPWGIVADGFGNIYFSDKINYRIRKINTSGNITTVAGNGINGYTGDGGLATNAELGSSIYNLGVDVNGDIFFPDYLYNCIREINTSGIITTIVGCGVSGFSGDGGPATNAEIFGPEGVIINASGDIYLTDANNHRVRMVNTSGIISTIAGNGVQGYSGDGGPATAAEFKAICGLSMDAQNNIYISDFFANNVRVINTSGIITTFAGNGTQGYFGDGGSATAAEFDEPDDVMVDASGNVYVSDTFNNRIRMINTFGIISTIVGNGVQGYSGDGGAATLAELFYPEGISVDGSGDLYIADQGNQRVRKVIGITGFNEVSEGNGVVKLFPNPNSGAFTLQVNGEKLKVNSVMEIYNVLGDKVYSQPISNLTSQLTINLGTPSPGIYMYRIIATDGSMAVTGKFVVE